MAYFKDEMQMELANMLDTQMSGGEPSPSHQIPPWPAPGDMIPATSDETSQPGKFFSCFEKMLLK